MPQEGRLIPPHGGYRKLRSFQCAQLVYDATVIFCDRFVEKRSRTHDQMIQAARRKLSTRMRHSRSRFRVQQPTPGLPHPLVRTRSLPQ